VARLVRSEPRFLVYNGEFLHEAMRQERIGEGEVLQALRSEGIASVEDVAAVVLESNGNLSVLNDAPDLRGAGKNRP